MGVSFSNGIVHCIFDELSYDVKNGNPAMWAPQITDFNANNTNHVISTVYR